MHRSALLLTATINVARHGRFSVGVVCTSSGNQDARPLVPNRALVPYQCQRVEGSLLSLSNLQIPPGGQVCILHGGQYNNDVSYKQTE